MKRSLLVLCVAALVIAALVFFWHRPEAESRTGPPPQAPVAVDVVELRKQQVPFVQELPGRIVASEVAEIRPQVSGIIIERLFVEGSHVTKGDQLYQIDPSAYEAALRGAKADLAKAKANVISLAAKSNRYEELVKIDAVSKQEFDDVSASLAQAKADVAIAEASVAMAEINLGYTKVYAPISGRIGKSLVTKGALVTANQPQELTTITRLDPVYVDIVQSADELMRIRQGLHGGDEVPVELLLEGQAGEYPHHGTLQFADVTVDRSTGSVQLRALFPNPEGLLLPGMFVRTRLTLEGREGILVPQRAAIRSKEGTLRVWVVTPKDTVMARELTAERAVGDSWLVTEGVRTGEKILASGLQKVREGMHVAPTLLTSADRAVEAAPAEMN